MNEQHESEPGFETGLSTKELEAGGVSAYAREQHELQAAYLVALHRPRNEMKAFSNVIKSCKRAGFAEKARYLFKRGKKEVNGRWEDNYIEGPSVGLAREMARCWGNIRHGIRVVSMDEDWVQVEGWALDMETNTRVGAEAKFKRLIQRKKKGGGSEWIRPDERDLRELVNKHGAICVRNSLLQLMPTDLVADAMKEVRNTIRAAADGELKTSREDAVKAWVLTFDRINVSVEMLEEFLGHKMADINADELAELKSIHASITDGNAKREDYFEVGEPEKKMGGGIDPASLKPGTPPTPKPQPSDAAKAPPATVPAKENGTNYAGWDDAEKAKAEEQADKAAEESKPKEAPKKGRTLL